VIVVALDVLDVARARRIPHGHFSMVSIIFRGILSLEI